MVERRFFVDPGDIRGEEVAVVRGTEHHHLSRVLRLGTGDEVSVFDGAGRGFRGIVERTAGEESLVRLTSPDDRAVEPVLRLTLAQGIPHHDKMDLIVQKVTEVGVSVIVPIVGERTSVRAGRTGEWKRVERWRRVARESARQCGRLRVPVVCEPAGMGKFLDAEAGGPSDHRFILTPLSADEPGAGSPVSLEMDPAAASATLAVGPEGGWSPEEVGLAIRGGFERLTLGPRVMRTETVGIVAAALILFLAGDLGAALRGRAPG
ncbi:MAG TPA: 16S rRNA (uracil(1498)-N(3))-methyltransferase [Patescibacteria group bacterium]|nr:16S rRNA (uracil(1498)-N(3))-methyltransferase [Patescibacteria group bacterium]